MTHRRIAAVAAAALAVAVPAGAAPRTDAERVADIGFDLITAGVARCPARVRSGGVTWRHLGQFERADRPALLRRQQLDRGPATLAVARRGPGAAAGLEPGDILLAIDGQTLPAPTPTEAEYDQAAATGYSDALDAAMAAALSQQPTVTLTILRDGRERRLSLSSVAACASRIHLAQSDQRNAFADGTRVLVTTGLLRQTRSDDEVAFVLAHELAHNILAHAATLRSRGVARNFTRVLGRDGKLLRATEREADELGIRLMQDAGYDPAAALAFLSRYAAGPSIAFLSAHDSGATRRKRIEALIASRQP